ncbi:ABC transporter substrate-binding protein [Paenibacillus hexagrammi]|uniref:ABC transporter substrate-binding protein n=1 Tax=Paenibacillus hexagrammi TaxID=2908839 RepID=A0ABY3SHG6_9BACL|nr:ABC transporter substrate-binding protein [Paenibacillus sp. YPD9-1]UJF32560.1 ABC transporter substrate-binding protein [Paenibacillus sp. YPD9-1]
MQRTRYGRMGRTAALLAGLAVIVLPGCNSNETHPPAADATARQSPAVTSRMTTVLPEKKEQKIVLGFSQLGAESAWRMANTNSIMEAAKELDIELHFSDGQQKQENQIKAIRSFIAQKVDVIAFSPVVESGWEPVLKEAKDAGIPVIVTDRAVDVSDPSLYVTYMGSDFLEEGRKAGKYLLDKMAGRSGPIRIVELQGTAGSAPTIDRKRGFEEIIQQNPDMVITKSQTGDFTRAKGKEIMEAMLKSGGNHIDVLFSHNDDMAIGAIQAIEEFGLKPGKDIIIVSVDGGRSAFQYMVDGKINCIVECNPLLGPQLMQAVKELEAGRILPKRIVKSEGVFTQEMAAKELPNRKY